MNKDIWVYRICVLLLFCEFIILFGIAVNLTENVDKPTVVEQEVADVVHNPVNDVHNSVDNLNRSLLKARTGHAFAS